jgi:hypothetical protein
MRSRLAQKKALTRRGVAAQETGAFRDHHHSRCLAKVFLLCSGWPFTGKATMDINDREIEVLLRRLQLLDRLERRICVMRVQIGRQRHEILRLRSASDSEPPRYATGRREQEAPKQKPPPAGDGLAEGPSRAYAAFRHFS